MEAREERPGLFRPAGVGERVVAAFLLVGQLRIAKLDRPLLDVEAELRKVERQFVEPAKQPDERDPVEGRKIAPEDGTLVAMGEIAERVADRLAADPLALELRADVFERPWIRLRPVDLAALGVKLAPVLVDEPDADEVDRERMRDELGVEPVFHAMGGPRRCERSLNRRLSHENQERGSPLRRPQAPRIHTPGAVGSCSIE